MIAARSVRVIVRGTISGGGAGGSTMTARAGRAPRRASATSSGGPSGGGRPARPAAAATAGSRRNSPSRSIATSWSRRPASRWARYRSSRARSSASGSGSSSGSTPGGGLGRRGRIARLLMRISWLATATNALTLPSRSLSSVGERVEVGVGEGAERHRQDVELARLDQRRAAGPAGRRSSRAGPGSRPRADGPPRTRPRARPVASIAATRSTRPSARLVREPQPLAGVRVDAARPGGGSARRSACEQPAAAASSADASAWTRSRSSATRQPGTSAADAPDPRAVALAQRVRDPRPEAGVALARSRGAARRRARRARSRRRREGARRRRARAADRRRASRRTGRAPTVEPGDELVPLRRVDPRPDVGDGLAGLVGPPVDAPDGR